MHNVSAGICHGFRGEDEGERTLPIIWGTACQLFSFTCHGPLTYSFLSPCYLLLMGGCGDEKEEQSDESL